MQRRIVAYVAIAAIIIIIAVLPASARYVWFNGTVQGITADYITVAGQKYQIYHADLKVAKRVKKNDAIYEVSADLNDVRVGQKVSIRVMGGAVFVILIEAYY